MLDHHLHKAQILVFRTLRRNPTARFSELLRATNLDSDIFKFHLRKLIAHEYITKTASGEYILTPAGKEYANNLDEAKRLAQKQPKHSMILFASQIIDNGEKVFLFQSRLRNPYWGYWGLLSGPIEWGVPSEQTAAQEFKKQTGLEATFSICSLYRQLDYRADNQGLLEDKLFQVLKADTLTGELSNSWTGGHNEWMTLKQLKSTGKYFPETERVITMAHEQTPFSLVKVTYDPQDY